MSTIKHNHGTSHANSSHKSHSSAAPKAKSAEHNKEAKPAEKKDGFHSSKELDENKKSKDTKDTKDSKKTGDQKDDQKTEEGKGKDKDSLVQKLADLQKQLDDMKNKKPEQQPENLGGCCGKSHGSKKTDDPNQKEDPDSELTRLAVAVLQGPNAPQQQQPGAKPGDKSSSIKGITNPAQAKAELSQKYQQYKNQGVALRKETEQLVESALNSAGPTSTGTKPTDNKNTPTSNKTNTNHNQTRPLAKAS